VITDNVTFLLPYLKASSKANAAAIDNGATVHVITVGQEPSVRACVFSGSTGKPMKLLHAAEADDATTALRSLLQKTQSMLASHFNYAAKTASKRTKVDSGVASITSSPSTKFFGAKLTGPTTPAFSTPAKTPIAKLKAKARGEAKTQHVRNKSETGFFDAVKVNNKTFLETCGEPNIDGKDSGFLSSDGEVHPNRSFVKLAGADADAAVPVKEEDAVPLKVEDAVPVEEDDSIFF
jgi:hypothetical protein